MRVSEQLQVVVLVRHGETEGESSIRFHGANDVPLSDEGREHARMAAHIIGDIDFDVHLASSLSRAAETARIIRPGHEIELDDDLREIDFGRWEGLTREEIRALDPELEEAWRRDSMGFDFPDGERRADFRDRVDRSLSQAFTRDARSILLVAHKGIVRQATERLTNEKLPPPHPDLGEVLHLERQGSHFHRRQL